VTSADADFFHHHVGVAVSAYGDLIFTQSNQKHRETPCLIIVIDAFEDGIGRVGSSVHIQQRVLLTFVHKLCLVVFLADLTFGFLVGVEKGVVLFPFDNIL
jgi:hypothetical protein